MSLRRAGESRLVYPVGVLILAAAYYGAAKAGLSLAYENSSVTAVWAPTGIALAALVLGGRRLWPGIALGAFLANVGTGISVFAVLGITAGNTLEALLGAYLLVRVARFEPSLERVRDVLALVAAASLSTAACATVGVLSLDLGGALMDGSLGSLWRTWWLGDLGGDLLIAPVLLVLFSHPWRSERPTRARTLEAFALAATLTCIGIVVFSHEVPVSYLLFPPLLWGALRFGQAGATLSSLAIAAIAVAFTANGTGIFVQDSPDSSLLLSQTFAAAAAVTALLLAALTSERRRAEAGLRGAHAELERKVRLRTMALAEAQAIAHVGSWEWDVATGSVTWSDEMYRICGRAPGVHVPTYEGYLELLHPDDRGRVEAAIGRACEQGGSFAHEERILRPGGEVRVLASRGEVFLDADARPQRMVGVCQDVTERSEAERLKDEFFALVSHELRTPLTSVSGYLELAARAPDEEVDPSRYIEVAQRGARRLERLVGDLLFMAQLEAGHLRLEPRELDLYDVAADAVEAARPRATADGLELVFDAEPGATCVGDYDRLAQALDNLLSNATKYTPPDGQIEVRLTCSGARARIEVADDGCGISAEDQRHVFERFYRGAAAVDASAPGAGLGLGIVKAIVEAHGGTVTLESRLGAGTTFTVELPLSQAAATAPGLDAPAAELAK